jgi:hypothetical protein
MQLNKYFPRYLKIPLWSPSYEVTVSCSSLSFLNLARRYPPQPENSAYADLAFVEATGNMMSTASSTSHAESRKRKRDDSSKEENESSSSSGDKEHGPAISGVPISSFHPPQGPKKNRVEDYIVGHS